MDVAIYARVSSDKQDTDLSISAQLKISANMPQRTVTGS
jgi:predicted site-specific integrase-resolvase